MCYRITQHSQSVLSSITPEHSQGYCQDENRVTIFPRGRHGAGRFRHLVTAWTIRWYVPEHLKHSEKHILTECNAVRAPCPMLSTLANHGFLPHSGKDINQDTFVNALFDALNMNNTLGNILWKTALFTNPNKNATTFSLNDLGNHNVLEHDASLR